LVTACGGPDAYSYVFEGQLGYLDHALGNARLTPQVAGVAECAITADEIPLFDYNDDGCDAGGPDTTLEDQQDLEREFSRSGGCQSQTKWIYYP
jgi:predicted extracellular nuclease